MNARVNKAAPTTIPLAGRFDAHEVPAFVARIDTLLANDASDIAVDLQSVLFIDSIALAELVKLHRRVEELGHHLLLLSPSDPVRVILDVTGLVTLFNISLNATFPS